MAKKKPIVGERYCKNPNTLSGNKRAPYEKRIRGTDVVKPEQTSSRPVGVMFSIKDHDVVSTVSTYHRAIGVISHASKAMRRNGFWMVSRFLDGSIEAESYGLVQWKRSATSLAHRS